MDEQRVTSNALLTMIEISEAIQKQEKDKAPGPDGIPTEYYKQYESIITDILKNMIANILDGDLPESQQHATTILIPF